MHRANKLYSVKSAASKAFCFALLPLLLTCGLCVEYSRPSARLGEFLRNFVTYYPAATKDPSGKEVIGYGHICVSAGCADVSGFKQPLTVSNAAELLEQDLQEGISLATARLTQDKSHTPCSALASLFSFAFCCCETAHSLCLIGLSASVSLCNSFHTHFTSTSISTVLFVVVCFHVCLLLCLSVPMIHLFQHSFVPIFIYSNDSFTTLSSRTRKRSHIYLLCTKAASPHLVRPSHCILFHPQPRAASA